VTKKKVDCPTTAEWVIMNILYQENPLTATQIMAKLPSSLRWKKTTVKTMMARMKKAGFVSFSVSYAKARSLAHGVPVPVSKHAKGIKRPVYGYSPAKSKPVLVKAEFERVLGSVFNGNPVAFIAYIMAEGGVGLSVYAAIKKVVRNYDPKQPSPMKLP
jgi:hypothetical protein